MAMQQDMAQQIQAQIQVWQAQIKEHQERLGQAGADAKAGYEKGLAQLRANVEEANRLRNAGVQFVRFHVDRPSLETVFLNLTGRRLRD